MIRVLDRRAASRVPAIEGLDRERRISAAADGVCIFLLALALRLAVVLWAKERIPPVADGHFYHVVATRIAQGLGYTWLWPDGAVTYAAHYPVGYPALLGVAYAWFGAAPWVAMSFNALLGSFAAVAAFHVASGATRRPGLVAGSLVAVHPALVAYTPALMTEGVAAALLMIAAWFVVRGQMVSARPLRWTLLVGVVLGLAVLVRPQCLLMAPVYGLATGARAFSSDWRAPMLRSVLVTLLAIGVCLPWTARNCTRMGRCVFVSANGGWNLLIGTAPHGKGSFLPLESVGVPENCRTEFREAFKDSCFSAAALARIREQPRIWLGLVPAKLSATFDYSGAPGWYLNAANPGVFGSRAQWVLGAIETLYERIVLAVALAALAFRAGPRRTQRVLCAGAGVLSLLTPLGYPGYLAAAGIALLLGRRLLAFPAGLFGAAAILTTALVHAIFFGAGRYSLVCFPFIAALAATLKDDEHGPSSELAQTREICQRTGEIPAAGTRCDVLLTAPRRAGDTAS